MKRISLSALAVFALAIAGCSSYQPLGAGVPAVGQINAYRSNQGCTGTVFGNADLCYDTSANYATYYNNGGVWALKSSADTAITAPSATITGTADKTLNVSNGGHISNPIGTGTAPTSGTGTITAGGTDTAFECTGGTSPVTITFGTAFAVKPSCVCSDETSATQTAKPVPNSNGQTLVVTSTGTDSFACVCIGH